MMLAFLKPLLVRSEFVYLVFIFEFTEVIRMCFDFLEKKSARDVWFGARTGEAIEL